MTEVVRRRARTRPECRPRPCAAAALALVVGCGGEPSAPGGPRPMTVRRVVREVLHEAPEWSVLEGRADGQPHLGVLTPSRDWRVRGADRWSLVLPPPARVRLKASDWPLPARLELFVGLDRSAFEEHAEALSGHRLRFVVSAEGRVVREAEVATEPVGRLPGSEWRALEPLDLDRVDALVLETLLLGPGGEEVDFPAPLAAGFGGLQLVRERRRARTPSSPEAPNLVLIVMDTQRADRLSTYGYERPTSPNLDRLAARGLVFEEAYATSNWTWPSTASILTGLHPGAHGLLGERSAHLAESLVTLPEVLQDAGLTTVGWSANYLLASDKNFDQGFESWRHAVGHSQASAEVVPEVLEWMGAAAGTRFFLYLHLLDPHAPQDPLPEGRALLAPDVPPDFSPTAIDEFKRRLFSGECHDETGRLDTAACVSPEEQGYVSDLYDACTWSGDWWLGRVLDRLEELELEDETVVVFTSDHGEELFEHGMLTHGHTLHPEVVRVPLVMAGPGVPEGVRVAGAISNRHVAPTLARLAGTELPAAVDALDLLALEVAPDAAVHYTTATGWWNGHRRTPIHGLRTEEHVLHWAPEAGDWGRPAPEEGQWRVYDVREDPDELRDLGAEAAERAGELLRALREHERAARALRVGSSVEAGAATLEGLRALGYLDGE